MARKSNARSTVREWTRKVSSEPRPKELAQGGLTPLMFAARTGCIECAELLLGAGADINLPDPYGVTPLLVATLNLQNDFAAYLVEKGADFTQWDLYGRTPLYVAIDMMDYPPPRGGDSAEPMSGLELAELLLDRGANPNSQLKQWRPPFVRLARGQDNTLATGATPLLRAAHASDVAAVKLLLEHKALVDLPNASGITPLMAAAGVGVSQNTSRAKKKTEAASIEVARLLLEAGADVNRVTHDPRRIRTDPWSARPCMDSSSRWPSIMRTFRRAAGRRCTARRRKAGTTWFVCSWRTAQRCSPWTRAAGRLATWPWETTSSRSPRLARIR